MCCATPDDNDRLMLHGFKIFNEATHTLNGLAITFTAWKWGVDTINFIGINLVFILLSHVAVVTLAKSPVNKYFLCTKIWKCDRSSLIGSFKISAKYGIYFCTFVALT